MPTFPPVILCLRKCWCPLLVSVVVLFACVQSSRQAEILSSLRKNLENEQFAKIHIFVANASVISDDLEALALLSEFSGRVRIVSNGKRLTFSDVFKYTLAIPSMIIVLSNNDITFDGSIGKLRNRDYLRNLGISRSGGINCVCVCVVARTFSTKTETEG